jgi:hypothetical protein
MARCLQLEPRGHEIGFDEFKKQHNVLRNRDMIRDATVTITGPPVTITNW